MPSSARSSDSQKLISCDAVPEATSRLSFVTPWIALIHELTLACSELRKELSLSSLGGMNEIFGRAPAASAC